MRIIRNDVFHIWDGFRQLFENLSSLFEIIFAADLYGAFDIEIFWNMDAREQANARKFTAFIRPYLFSIRNSSLATVQFNITFNHELKNAQRGKLFYPELQFFQEFLARDI